MVAPTSVSPDDRALSRTVLDVATKAVPVGLTVRPGGFDWEDAAIGGAFGLALALFGTGAIAMVHHRRGTLSTA